GHRGHGGAVGVGDDSLGGALDGLGVDLGHDERDLGVHPPGRGVVHHGGTGSSETFGLGTGGGTARGEHRNVDTAEVGGLHVLDHHVLTAPGQRLAGAAGGGEVADLIQGEVAFGEQVTHHGPDLSGGADHGERQRHVHRPVPP